MNGCLFLGWERAKFIIYMCFLLHLLLGCWEKFLLFLSNIHHLNALREAKGGERNELWQVWFSPGYFTTFSTSHQVRGPEGGGVEEIICKNRFNFKFIFAFTLHRHVYYIDFDIIAIILQTMMCFFPPPSFPICVFSSKSMFLKGEERTANLKAFHTLFKSIFHTKLGRFHQLCNVWENKPVALLWAAAHKFMFHFKYSALKNRVQVN